MLKQLTPISGLSGKLQSFHRIFTQEGPRAALTSSRVAAARWWRQGEIWELRKSEHVRLGGCRFGLDRRIAPPLRDLLATGLFESPERNIVRRYLDRSSPVIEFGGCIGVVACTTNLLLIRPRHHVVVEANPALVRIIEENRDRNGCDFTLIHAAVGYGRKMAQLRFSEVNPLESGAYCETGAAVDVATISLREIVTRHGFQRCSLICDIEGSEFDLIQQEADVLGERVAMLVMELHQRLLGAQRTQTILDTLQKEGFRLLDRVHETCVFRNTTIE
jgi:FkbM family methyltransferase